MLTHSLQTHIVKIQRIQHECTRTHAHTQTHAHTHTSRISGQSDKADARDTLLQFSSVHSGSSIKLMVFWTAALYFYFDWKKWIGVFFVVFIDTFFFFFFFNANFITNDNRKKM